MSYIDDSCEKVEEISVYGKVVALSHTFRTLNGLVFFIELLSDQKLIHIVVNISSHQFWSQLIEYGSSYSISCLCRNILWKQSHNVEVLVVTKKSELLLLRRSSCLEECKEQSLANFEGVITEVVNDHLGVFKVNGEITLLLPYLIGLVTEFSEEKSQFFRVGDHVLVLNAHKINGNNGNSTLLCCGRSFVKNISAPEIHRSSDNKRKFSDNGILHCLHKYNLGVEFFYWLCNLEEILICSAPSEIKPESIVRREYNERKGALTQFISRLADFKTIKPVRRPILEEFLLKEHKCTVLKEFQQPFCPSIIEHITCHQPDNIMPALWKHHVIKKKEHNWVMFGILKLTEEGFLKLITNGSSILVIFLEGKHNIYNKLDNLVAIINFDWIEEIFSIYGHENEKMTKRYIIVRSTNILSLVPSSLSKAINGVSYEIKIFSKSGLYFNHDGTGSFFICNASVTHLDSYISREENWQTLLCFKRNLAKLYPCISNKTGIQGKIIKNKDPGCVAFRKKRNFAWLRSTHDYFGTTECVDVPETYEIENIGTHNSPSTVCYSVLDILESKCDDNEAITVEGLVTKRLLVSSLFKSENFDLSASVLNHQIGIPGSKILRFYLQDVSHSHATICIYLNGGTDKCYLRQYPLGIIPGVKLRITWLKKNISKQCNTYLLTTNFTTINVISEIGPQSLLESPECTGKRKYLSQINLLKHSTVVTLFVTISSIIVIDLKMMCPFCESDFKDGQCDYVGCHATEPGILTGSSKFVVDDGTGVAIVLTKELEHVKILCNLNSQQWKTFAVLIGDRPISLYPKTKLKDSHDPLSKLSLLLNSSQILRPVVLTCRTFIQSSNFSPNLFLLNIKSLNCNADWKSILHKNF